MSASSCWCKDAIGVAGPSSNVLLNPWLKHTIEEFPELLEPIEKQFFCFFLWWDTLALKDTQNLKHTQLLDNVGILANQCLGSLVNLSMIYCICHPFGTIFSKKQQCSRQIFQKVKKKSKRITTQHVRFYPKKDLQNQAASSPPIFWSFLPSIFEMASATSGALSQCCSGSSMGGRALGTISTSTSFPTAR